MEVFAEYEIHHVVVLLVWHRARPEEVSEMGLDNRVVIVTGAGRGSRVPGH